MTVNRPVTSESLRALLTQPDEQSWTDFKLQLLVEEFSQFPGEEAEFIRDVVAISNMPSEGFLVYGVRDADRTPVGIQNASTIRKNTSQLHAKVATKCSEEVDFEVHLPSMDGMDFCVVGVRPVKHRPNLLTQDFGGPKKEGKERWLRQGQIPFRRGDSTLIVVNASELRSITRIRPARQPRIALEHVSSEGTDGRYEIRFRVGNQGESPAQNLSVILHSNYLDASFIGLEDLQHLEPRHPWRPLTVRTQPRDRVPPVDLQTGGIRLVAQYDDIEGNCYQVEYTYGASLDDHGNLTMRPARAPKYTTPG